MQTLRRREIPSKLSARCRLEAAVGFSPRLLLGVGGEDRGRKLVLDEKTEKEDPRQDMGYRERFLRKKESR